MRTPEITREDTFKKMVNEFLTGRLGYRKLAEKFGKRLGKTEDSRNFIYYAIKEFFAPLTEPETAEGSAVTVQRILNSKLTPFLHIYVL